MQIRLERYVVESQEMNRELPKGTPAVTGPDLTKGVARVEWTGRCLSEILNRV